jgi:hypothetical protein
MLRPILEWQSCFWKCWDKCPNWWARDGGESLIDTPLLPCSGWHKIPQWKTLTYHQRFMIPYVFCKVFATWISVCILQSICYMNLSMHFAKCLLHDSPNGFCKVFATWFSQWILQSVCYMILPMYFGKVLATWISQCILQSIGYMILPMYFAKYLLHDSPNVFLQSICYMIPNVICNYLLHDLQIHNTCIKRPKSHYPILYVYPS